MTEIAKITYEAPRIEDIGSLVELTAKAKFDDQVPALRRGNNRSESSESDTTRASGPATLTSSGSW